MWHLAIASSGALPLVLRAEATSKPPVLQRMLLWTYRDHMPTMSRLACPYKDWHTCTYRAYLGCADWAQHHFAARPCTRNFNNGLLPRWLSPSHWQRGSQLQNLGSPEKRLCVRSASAQISHSTGTVTSVLSGLLLPVVCLCARCGVLMADLFTAVAR